jgi:beta-glucosidase/6-phospho-beta-glucosidase/beta-galactosidase
MHFPSFILGGFECADHINRSGIRVDLLRDTGHDVRADEDYANLAAMGIRSVREGIRWGFVERRPFEYDFTEVLNRIRAGLRHGIVQCWDICHFGYPDDLSPCHPLFSERFAAICQAFVQVFRQEAPTAPLIITPVNEVSFLSWHSGDMRGTVPFAINSGWDIKYHLCKASIAGIRAIRAMDSSAKILLVDPLIHVHPREEFPEDLEVVAQLNEDQFQAIDMILGRICPELGGRADYADMLGFNYYHTNQWLHTAHPLPWAPGDHPRLLPVADILERAYQRYGLPLMLSETGHFGEHRSNWLYMIMEACEMALERGIDLRGVCIYPIIDRPDWDNMHVIDCGVWGYDAQKNRIPHEASVAALQELAALARIAMLV